MKLKISVDEACVKVKNPASSEVLDHTMFRFKDFLNSDGLAKVMLRRPGRRALCVRCLVQGSGFYSCRICVAIPIVILISLRSSTICGLNGGVLCCDGCSNVVHTKCGGLPEIPKEDWHCETCASWHGEPPLNAASDQAIAIERSIDILRHSVRRPARDPQRVWNLISKQVLPLFVVAHWQRNSIV